ncbi:MAG: PSD1 domain-containing protein [Bryobacterales bacterium]|nr:PSD1 domain-containing protein [Bryobacterales bacterium]
MRKPVLLILVTTLVASGEAPRYESGIQPLLAARCQGCHNSKSAQAGLSVATRDDLLKGGKSGAAVVPGKPVDSLLLTMVAAGTMPKAGAKLTEAEVARIRTWIEGGALRDGEQESARKPVRERDVHAILSAKCWVCHGRREQKGGLDLRTLGSMRQGGKSGPALVAGNPEGSLLVKRIVKQEMPPPKLQEEFSVRGLTADELQTLEQWIREGAVEDREEPAAVEQVRPKDREFWAFRAPQAPAEGASVDSLLLAKLKPAGLAFNPPADRRTLIRRLYLDLTGLPPTPEQLAADLADKDPRFYSKLVNRLLDSPRHGERWARYWLDAVGYADSEGGTSADSSRPHAWRYRDYVVRSFNAGKPFDQFLTDQIAGDELFDYKARTQYTAEEIDLLAATGFWRMAPDSTYSTEQNFIPERMDVIAGQLEILGSAVLGMSVGCARCHDHKYDPIPQSDYYRLVSILTPAYDPYSWLSPNKCLGVGANCGDDRMRHIVMRAGPEHEAVAAHNAPIERTVEELERQRSAASDAKVKADLNERIRKEKAKLKERPKIRALFDLGPQPPPNRVLLRGDPVSPGALVEPGVLSVLSEGLTPYQPVSLQHASHTTGRRLGLARWLTDPRHPLTARVMVNRIWQQHFGEGLVSSSGNFGKMGTPPANQALLDWLATEFVRLNWDIKAMHRLILNSAAYQQASTVDAARRERDPENKLLSRFPLRRLDSDALRDSILAVAGRLDLEMFGPPAAIETRKDGEVVVKPGRRGYRRTIFVEQKRGEPVSLLDAFDSPFLNPNCVKRGQSTVSSQALHLMNSDLLRESARYMAGRIRDVAGPVAQDQIDRAYLVALSRKPTAAESEAALRAMKAIEREWRTKLEGDPPAEPVASRAEWLGLATICHTILNSAEFQYVD